VKSRRDSTRRHGFCPWLDAVLARLALPGATGEWRGYRATSLDGFTLIELVLVIVVLGLTAVPLSLLLTEHIEGSVMSNDKALALQLGRMEMERVANLAYANVTSASFSNYQGYGFDVTRTVSYGAGGMWTPESLKQITVTVKKTGQADVLVNFITYRARNVIHGV